MTQSLLPEGSGMGTSSILAGCVIAAAWTATGRRYSHSDLVHKVLLAEQHLTTGGGWQDNVNGLCPGGFKVGESGPAGEPRVAFSAVPVGEAFRRRFEERVWLLLPRRDVTRLAKPILRVRQPDIFPPGQKK